MTRPEGSDPFDTAALRARVLAAWSASPARFREDANAEEDLALGGYRDRVVHELAQNAADAARSGRPGRLLLRLADGVLEAANTGVALDAAGVESLSTLRASAKRDDEGAAGRFGVGFAAVLAVSDEPMLLSASGGVRWSRSASYAACSELPSLAAELARRDGTGPVLRLPFPAAGVVPAGYDSVVRLPLRDEAASRLAGRLLAEVDAALLLALPALAEVVVETDGVRRELTAARARPGEVVVVDGGTSTRWQVVTASGRLDPELLRDRPVEERSRPRWELTWARPEGGRLPATTPAVLHAPTPTDEPLGLPALLVASFPLDPTRRHVAAGPATDALVGHAAEAYAELARSATDPLALLSGPVAVGALDAALRRAVLDALSRTPLLRAVGDPGVRVRPRDAVAVVGAPAAALPVLADVLAGLVADDVPPGSADSLGLRRVDLTDVVDQLAGLARPPAWWGRLYAALDGAARDALGALPVPLADGRLVTGPRGLLLPATDDLASALGELAGRGLRAVHPDAVATAGARRLLERLGALPGTPRAVLTDPAVRAVVEGSADEDDPPYEAVLALVRAAGVRPGEEPWLAELALPTAAGELAPAGELLLPGSPLAALVDENAFDLVDPTLSQRWGPDVLAAVGVLGGLSLLREPEVVLDPADLDLDLDDADAWVEDLLERIGDLPGDVPPLLPDLLAVRDLELVRDDAWPAALALLAQPPLREAVVDPALVVDGTGRRVAVLSYAAWWLRTHVRLDGLPPTRLRTHGAEPVLTALYDAVPAEAADEAFLTSIGVRSTLASLLAEPGGPDELLGLLADPARMVPRDDLRTCYSGLAQVDADRVRVPERVRTSTGEVADASAVVVLDAPDLLPLLAGVPHIAVAPELAPAVADLLDLPLASEELDGAVESSGVLRRVPDAVRLLLPAAPASYVEHDDLVVHGVSCAWRCVEGIVHAATLDGLARGLAWAAGAWPRRHVVAAVLADPDRVSELLAEEDFS